jgi:nucleotide-binding universal stress UspA family protein
VNAEVNRLPIVVGIDGSEESKRALAWAAGYAQLTATPLRVLVVWHVPTNYGWTVPLPEAWDPERDARAVLEQETREVLGSSPDVELSTSAVEGHPAQILAEASKSASLIVVGSRGRGKFAGKLLGSVSAFLATHASCPVLIMHDATEG